MMADRDRIKRAVRRAERKAGDGTEISGTGQTILKQRLPPIAMLVETGEIAQDELQAADEILASFFALTGRLWIRSPSFERIDASSINQVHQMARISVGITRFQRWADVWSVRAKLNSDPMLEVIIAAVVDERPISVIAADIGRSGRGYKIVKNGIVCGLRDYAARAGWITGA